MTVYRTANGNDMVIEMVNDGVDEIIGTKGEVVTSHVCDSRTDKVKELRELMERIEANPNRRVQSFEGGE